MQTTKTIQTMQTMQTMLEGVGEDDVAIREWEQREWEREEKLCQKGSKSTALKLQATMQNMQTMQTKQPIQTTQTMQSMHPWNAVPTTG